MIYAALRSRNLIAGSIIGGLVGVFVSVTLLSATLVSFTLKSIGPVLLFAVLSFCGSGVLASVFRILNEGLTIHRWRANKS